MNYMFSLFTVCFFLPLCLISFLLVFPLSFLVYFWFFLWSIFSLSFNFFPFSPSSSSSSTLCSCSPSSPLPSIPFLSPWFSHPGPSRSLFRPSARPSSSAAWDHRHKYPGSPQRPVKGGGGRVVMTPLRLAGTWLCSSSLGSAHARLHLLPRRTRRREWRSRPKLPWWRPVLININR